MFDQHELICADGAWSESFHPGVDAMSALNADQRDELLELFPELELAPQPTARPSLQDHQVKALLG